MMCRNIKTSAQWFCRQIFWMNWQLPYYSLSPANQNTNRICVIRGDAKSLAAYKPQLFLWLLRIIYNKTDIHVPARNAVTHLPASCDNRRSIIIHHDLCHGLPHNAVYCAVRHKMDRSPDSFPKEKIEVLALLPGGLSFRTRSGVTSASRYSIVKVGDYWSPQYPIGNEILITQPNF